MDTTTPAAIRSDFEQQLEALTPNATKHQVRGWRRVNRIADVHGHELRNFYIEHASPTDDALFVHGDGRDYVYEMAVWTSYGGLTDHDYEDLRAEDSVQLSALFQSRYEPTVTGLLTVIDLGWEEGEDSDEGRRWGAHTFEVRYFAPHTA